jgi:hypothetical protein
VDTRQLGRQILCDAVREIFLVRVVREIGEGRTTIESRAASAGGGVVATTGALRLPARKNQTPPAIEINATIPATSGKSDVRGFGSGVFAAVAGFFSCVGPRSLTARSSRP